MSYDNSLRGALFVNDRKEKDTHPDYRGSIETEDGQEYWASAWIKEPRGGGKKYISIALTPKDDNGQSAPRSTAQKKSDAEGFLANNRAKIDKHRPAPSSAAPQPAQDFDSFDDDIPF